MKWHLRTEQGRQTWVYDSKLASDRSTFVDRYHLGLDIVLVNWISPLRLTCQSKDAPKLKVPRSPEDSLKNAVCSPVCSLVLTCTD